MKWFTILSQMLQGCYNQYLLPDEVYQILMEKKMWPMIFGSWEQCKQMTPQQQNCNIPVQVERLQPTLAQAPTPVP